MSNRTTTGRGARTTRPPVGAPRNAPSPRGTSVPRGGPASGPAAAPASRSRRWVGPLAGVVVGVQLGLLAGLLLPGGTAEEPPAASSAATADPLAERVAELQAEEAARDAEAVTGLTASTGEVLELLAPVVEAGAAYPPGSPPPDAADVADWREAVDQAREGFGETPSAGTGVNVARAGLVSSLDSLEAMVDAFALAGQVPDPDPVLALAERSRRSAALSWSVGATQLDAVNVDAGNGHVHLFLPAVEGSGALTADPEPPAGG